MFVSLRRAVRLLSITVALGPSGCGQPDGSGDAVEVVQSALVANDFGVNTPFVKIEGDPNSIWPAGGGGGFQKFVAQRRGYGTSPNAIDNAAVPAGSLWYKDVASSSYLTSTRPLFWLNETNAHWSEVYADAAGSNEVLDDSPGTPVDTFPYATFLGRTVQGPPSPLVSHVFSDFQTVYALFSGGHIHKGYITSSSSWSDIILPIGNDASPAVSANVPTSSPQALNRSFFGAGQSDNSDSVWFSCGAATPARACEFRLGGAGSYKTFSVSYGSGTSFLAKTRPVAFADVTRSSSHERWVFAAISGSGGTRSIFGQHETSDIVLGSQPSYTRYTLDTGTSTTVFSSPMPYMYYSPGTGTLTLAVVYFRTDGGTTKIMEAKSVYPYTSWSAAQIFDTGAMIPAGSEPVPSSSPVELAASQVNSIIYRLPSGNVLATAELRQEQTTPYAYVQTLLPSFTDESNLYVMQNSTSSLYKVDEEANAASPPALGTAIWSGVTAFASDDGRGLAYATQGTKLWEINLNDGSRRQIGPSSGENWTGTTKLASGFDGVWPALWAIRSNRLYKVDLSTGKSTELWGHFAGPPAWDFWTNVGAMSTMVWTGGSTQPSQLFVTRTGDRTTDMYAQSLYKVDINSGVPGQLGHTGDWTNAIAMTANAADGRLYIADGVGSTPYRVYRVDAATGEWTHGYSGTFSNPQFMTTINGVPYLMKSQVIYRLSSSGDTNTQNVALHGIGSGSWGYTVTGLVGRNYDVTY